MKRLFTLLFAVGFLTAVNAQTSSRDNRDRDSRDNRTTQQNGQWGNDSRNDNGRYDNDDRYDNNYDSYRGDIRMQIAQINRKYDFKIDRVRDNRFMRRHEKMRMIRSLEEQRQQEIRMAYARSNRRGQHDRDRDHDHDRDHDQNHRY
jgi:hypothetical protein